MKAASMVAAAVLGIILISSSAFANPAFDASVLSAPRVTAPQKGGQTVPIDQLPAAVTAAIEKAYPKSTIVSAMRLSRGKQERYELSVKATADAQPMAITISPEGIMRGGKKAPTPVPTAPAAGKGARKAAAVPAQPQGEPVANSQLPKAVVQAIKDAYPKDTIIDAVKITTGDQVTYQLLVRDLSSMTPLRVFVTSDGKIQKR